MKCPRCQHENPAGMRFCGQCAAPLAAVCPSCGASNPPENKFCGQCATPVTKPAQRRFGAPEAYTPKHLAEKILTSRGALEGERKQVTVLFCDIVESSRLAERLGAETMHEVIDRVLRVTAEAVHRYDGAVNQFLGDGLMALFGAPVALEDHALRAVQAALAIQETIGGLSRDLERERGEALAMRIGLNTGIVVVGRIGDDLRMDYTAIGDTTNLAARMQSQADPRTILVTEATHRLVEGYVRSDRLGVVSVRGLSAPVAVYRISGRRGTRTRLEVDAERGLTPLVGRERELGLLRDCFERAKAGRGHALGVVGEAGVGKSRLVREFRRSLDGEPVTWLEGHCVSYGQSTPYLPVIEILKANFHIEEDDNLLQIQEKIHQGLFRLDPALEELLPPLGELLSVRPSSETERAIDPKVRRQKFFEAIRALTMAGAQRRPHVIVFEDLHWIDSASEDYLTFLVESLPAVPLLLITTQRPGYTVRWADKTSYAQVALDVLTEREVEVLVTARLGRQELPSDLVGLISERAEGNPLFVEEIVRSLLERGMLIHRERGLAWAGEVSVDLPPTVHDIIRARIDRLEEPVKRTLQTAAVIGREFGIALLRRAAEAPEAIECHLGALKQAELIQETRFFPELAYRFRHGVIQSVAYEVLLSHRRRELHRKVGSSIEAVFAGRLIEHYEILAHHFSVAGDSPKTIEYLVKAGGKALEVFANREARGFYERALALLADGPDETRGTVLRQLAEVTLTLADPDASLRYAESALELYRKLADRRGIVAMHLHLNFLYVWHWDGAREYLSKKHLEEAAALVADDPDSVEKGLLFQRRAHFALHNAQPDLCREWAQKALDVFSGLSVSMGTSFGTALMYVGRIDEGVSYNEGNWEPVRKAGVPVVISILGHELSLTLALARDIPRARRWGETILAEIAKAGPVWEGFLRRPLALIYALAGEEELGVESCDAVVGIESQTRLGCIYEDAASVGVFYLRQGDWSGARQYLEHALSIYEDRYTVTAVSACAFALGNLELVEGHHRRAEELLLRSLGICRSGGNVLFELWVLPVLAELYLRLGQPAEASEHVARGLQLLAPDQSWYGLPAPIYVAAGMLAATERRWDEAARFFQGALEINRRYGLPWDEAKTLYEWGLMLCARAGRSDDVEARKRLEAAKEIFQRIGARKDAEKVIGAASA